MKTKFQIVLLICLLKQTVPVRADLLADMKAQVVLPTNVASFISAKEQQACEIVAKGDLPLQPDLSDYFAAAKAGDAQEARKIFSGLLRDTNDPAYRSPLKEVALDAELALEAFASGNAALVQSAGEDLMKSLPPGCVYFGGTDPGRGLPTLLCKSPGDPIFVLSQNRFLDARYMEYVHEMYGAKIQLPTTNEVKEIIDTAYVDKAKTNFNSQNAWFAASIQILKKIITQNPDLEFYYEQSFPSGDLSSNLSPHGLVMKISRQPLDRIADSDIADDEKFWTAKIAQLTNNPAFATDNYVRKDYAHWRGAIAGLYAWRAQMAKDTGERERMFAAATNAFGQSLTLDAVMPETVFREANLFLAFGKLDEAMAVAQNALSADPSNEQIKKLVANLQQYKTKTTTATIQSATAKPSAADRLKQLESIYQQGLINKEDYEKKKKEILDPL